MRKVVQVLVILCSIGSVGFLYPTLQAKYRVMREIPTGCGVIEGTVLDSNGRPIIGARVYSLIADRPPSARSLDRFVVTDPKGFFSLPCVEPGRNRIYASKEAEGYPDSLLSPFLDDQPTTNVVVEEQKIVKGLEVRLPPKGARLVVRVVDAVTHEAIAGATLRLCRADSTHDCRVMNANLTKNGYSQVLPAIRLTVEASAPNHESRYYGGGNGSKNQPAVVALMPDRTKTLTIVLRSN